MMQDSNKPVDLGVHYVEIDEGHLGQRIDNFLLGYFGRTVPRTLIYRILRKGEVRVNKKRIRPDHRLEIGDRVRVPPVRTCAKHVKRLSGDVAQLLTARILYEDDLFLILNKPSGLPVHGGTAVSRDIMSSVRAMKPQQKFLELAHRLDKETSGCLVIAKKRKALLAFQEQLTSGRVKKRYLVLTKGHWQPKELSVNAPLLKNQRQSGERMVHVSAEGKSARTNFKIMWVCPHATLLEADLLTGRTHQIRVHAQYRGHCVAGDKKYGDRAFNQRMKLIGLKRMFLHAHSISFSLPLLEKEIDVKAPLDDDLEICLTRLGKEE
jgi:23S rRNA pseudouridine955/2504/2580 synthase